MKKLIMYFFVLSLIVNNITVPIHAQENKFPDVIEGEFDEPEFTYTISEEERKSDIDRQIQESLAQTPVVAMDEIVYEYVVVDDSFKNPKITPYSNYYKAGGQSKGGTIFENSIGSIHWKSSGGETIDISLSVSLSAGPASISVGLGVGSVTSPSQAERSMQITKNQIGVPVMLYVRKSYAVTRYAVYKYNKYSGPSTKVLSHYQDYKTPYSISLMIKEL